MGAKVDITGQKFGMLTAIEPTDQRKDKKIVWRCRCDCGREVFVTAKELRAGKTQTCGKHGREDLTGQRFGRLTALYLLEEMKGTRTSSLGDKPPVTNTSGVRGVSWSKRDQK